MRLLFATTNRGKVAELQGLVGSGLEVVCLADLAPVPEIEEDADTFQGNAEKKARGYLAATGLAALADDSGLCVDALGGRPGVLSARYAPTDAAKISRLLEELREVPDEGRGASFHCALALALPSGRVEQALGRCEGRIAQAPRGGHGFGYDPVFLVPPYQQTFAELTLEEKARCSHRGAAFALLRPALLSCADLANRR